MARSQIDQFMNAISGIESGGDYNARNPTSGAHGRYQIMPENWPAWSKEAFGKVVAKTPTAQRRVAKNKMLQYYDNYGSWDAVAVAWFAGPGRAKRWKAGDTSVGKLSDKTKRGGKTYSTSVDKYVQTIMDRMGNSGGNEVQETDLPPNPYARSESGEFDVETLLKSYLAATADTQAGGARSTFEDLGGTEALLDDVDESGAARSGYEVPDVDDVGFDDPTKNLFEFRHPNSPQSDPVDISSPDTARLIEQGEGGVNQEALMQALTLGGDLGLLTPENEEVNLTPSEPSAKGQSLVDAATEYLGVPYLWGGTNPNKGLDCSGMIQLAAKNLGIKLPRVSRDQAKAGRAVSSMAEAQPGDLIAFNSPVSHIGIYMGNNKMLHAPRSGKNVEITTLTKGRLSNLTAIRRVIN